MFKKFIEILKQEHELTKAQRRLAHMPFDYLTIQNIVNAVGSGFETEVIVKQHDGTEITIRKTNNDNKIPFQSFAEKFTKYQNGVKI